MNSSLLNLVFLNSSLINHLFFLVFIAAVTPGSNVTPVPSTSITVGTGTPKPTPPIGEQIFLISLKTLECLMTNKNFSNVKKMKFDCWKNEILASIMQDD
jgi:hypothetical protein